jgi:hypothetical protein
MLDQVVEVKTVDDFTARQADCILAAPDQILYDTKT